MDSDAQARSWLAERAARLALPSTDLLRDAVYRRLWLSILISSFGAQVTMLAIPLTAAVLLHATPSQMGYLTAMELLPFALFSLPAGVWLDRVRKLPVYISGELLVAGTLATVPLAWMLGWLGLPYMYFVAFVIGCVVVCAGTAAQIVLTQIVPRSRLVEAHARNALASSAADVAGPGLAGALIRLVGAPAALLADAFMLLASVTILRKLPVVEPPLEGAPAPFGGALKAGLRFVRHTHLLVVMALLVGAWQLCHHAAMVVQILFATRELGLNERQVGLCYIGVGLGTVAGSAFGNRISRRLGVGPTLLLGFAICGAGWLQLAFAPANAWGVASFVGMLTCFGFGAVLMFINFLALRQAVTPVPLLGRMTSTMRWLILLPALPGALLGGTLGEHLGLRWSLAAAGAGALLLALVGLRWTMLRGLRVLPEPAPH
ncbi:MFS transporter [Ramlibacter sp. XY19]|uniref:MFS transporter n=1 Tax=Ramlibacter paludis TaxID=2908000 RepID=UPI0023DBC2D9|nr:MFS transporter [Ramlibacter paludis]MCG2593504.1 MFS transporter [Ramlibacter paludis]